MLSKKFSTTNLTLKSVTIIITNYLQNIQWSLTSKQMEINRTEEGKPSQEGGKHSHPHKQFTN